MATVTSQDIANQALLMVGGNQPLITGQAPNFDDSTAGKAVAKLYAPCVATVARQFGWDFGRSLVALSVTGNTAPVGWTYEYVYPSNGVQLWQLQPSIEVDPNNPLPVNWSVGNVEVSGIQTKVIWSNLPNATATYNNNPTEATWDAGFREAVVRLLASELAMALEGKPDVVELMLQSAAAMETQAEGRED